MGRVALLNSLYIDYSRPVLPLPFLLFHAEKNLSNHLRIHILFFLLEPKNSYEHGYHLCIFISMQCFSILNRHMYILIHIYLISIYFRFCVYISGKFPHGGLVPGPMFQSL